MARTPRKSALTTSTTVQMDRQTRRLNRQQKQLERQLLVEMGQTETKLTGATSKPVTLKNLKSIEPLTDTQKDFFDAYNDGEEAIVLYGSAGTGKTTIAIALALRDILDTETPYDKLIIIRSCVPSREIGHLPGTADEKMEQYEFPYHGVCEFLFGRKDAYTKLKESGKIEFVSTSFMRGLTFDNAIVVMDETQSATWHELATVVTRVGKDTKILFCGDHAQNDLITKKNDVSGFRDFMAVTTKMEDFRHFRFTTDDIVRSGLVKRFLVQCEKMGL